MEDKVQKKANSYIIGLALTLGALIGVMIGFIYEPGMGRKAWSELQKRFKELAKEVRENQR